MVAVSPSASQQEQTRQKTSLTHDSLSVTVSPLAQLQQCARPHACLPAKRQPQQVASRSMHWQRRDHRLGCSAESTNTSSAQSAVVLHRRGAAAHAWQASNSTAQVAANSKKRHALGTAAGNSQRWATTGTLGWPTPAGSHSRPSGVWTPGAMLQHTSSDPRAPPRSFTA